MSNDIKSQPQAAPPDLGRSPQPNLAHPRPQERAATTDNSLGHPASPFRTVAPDPKMASLPGLKMQSGRPFLTESAPQAEFHLSYTKQRTEEFLTEARTHIK